jgi:hypothetical protein
MNKRRWQANLCVDRRQLTGTSNKLLQELRAGDNCLFGWPGDQFDILSWRTESEEKWANVRKSATPEVNEKRTVTVHDKESLKCYTNLLSILNKIECSRSN